MTWTHHPSIILNFLLQIEMLFVFDRVVDGMLENFKKVRYFWAILSQYVKLWMCIDVIAMARCLFACVWMHFGQGSLFQLLPLTKTKTEFCFHCIAHRPQCRLTAFRTRAVGIMLAKNWSLQSKCEIYPFYWFQTVQFWRIIIRCQPTYDYNYS